jgi:thymidylate kinase
MDKDTPVIVILTGVDGTGKTTIKKALEKKSNYDYIVLDRFTDSIVYDGLYNRKDKSKQYIKLEQKLDKIANVLLVYLYCDGEILLKRLIEKKEDMKTIENIPIAEKLYKKYLSITPFKNIKLDTSILSVEECVDKIIKRAEKEVK